MYTDNEDFREEALKKSSDKKKAKYVLQSTIVSTPYWSPAYAADDCEDMCSLLGINETEIGKGEE